MKTLLIVLIGLFTISLNAQIKYQLDSALFDFWVGDWDLVWVNADGSKSFGTTKIEKTLDNKVIQENFRDPSGGLKGTSISVFDNKLKTWHQAWADNQGGYYDFEGAVEAGKPIFRTKEINQIIQRMIFYNITPNSLTWDWEITKDGGKTWALQWQIFYSKSKP